MTSIDPSPGTSPLPVRRYQGPARSRNFHKTSRKRSPLRKRQSCDGSNRWLWRNGGTSPGSQVRPLAIASRERVEPLPDVPTIAESGYKGYELEGTQGIVAHAKTSK